MPNSSELSPNHSNGVVVAGGIFEMYSGTISGNTVEKNGGGVWVKHTGTFSVSSAPIIKDNKMGSVANNVYLGSGNTITVDSALTGGAEIWVTAVPAATEGNPKVFTAGYNDHNGTTEPSAFFHSDNVAYSVGANEAGEAQLTVPSTPAPILVSGISLPPPKR